MSSRRRLNHFPKPVSGWLQDCRLPARNRQDSSARWPGRSRNLDSSDMAVNSAGESARFGRYHPKHEGYCAFCGDKSEPVTLEAGDEPCCESESRIAISRRIRGSVVLLHAAAANRGQWRLYRFLLASCSVFIRAGGTIPYEKNQRLQGDSSAH
jgi:hypothetical protein